MIIQQFGHVFDHMTATPLPPEDDGRCGVAVADGKRQSQRSRKTGKNEAQIQWKESQGVEPRQGMDNQRKSSYTYK